MQFKILNKTGHPLTIKVMQGDRAIKTYQAPNTTPVQIEEILEWNRTHFRIEQSQETHGNIFWEIVGIEPGRLRYNTTSSNGNKDIGSSGEHLKNEMVIGSLTGGGHILVGEIGIIGDGVDA